MAKHRQEPKQDAPAEPEQATGAEPGPETQYARLKRVSGGLWIVEVARVTDGKLSSVSDHYAEDQYPQTESRLLDIAMGGRGRR